jgi:hypothetical protein
MIVWYRLPSIDADNIKLKGLDAPWAANNILFNYFYNDIQPFAVWFIENNLSPKPVFQWHKDFVVWQINVAVGFDIPEEYATMFRLKFGDGYRV